MRKLTNCPKCGSNDLYYEINRASLKCRYCEQIIPNKKIIKKVTDIEQLNTHIFSNNIKHFHHNKEKLHAIKCDSCGTIKYTKNKDSYKQCSICSGRKLTLLENKDNVKYILPFTISREEAYKKNIDKILEEYKNISKKTLEKLKQENFIGVYIPCRLENDRFVCSITGDAFTILRYHYDDDTGPEYTTLKHEITRKAEIYAKNIFYDRAEKDITTQEDMIENIISEISPYNMDELIEFKENYLEEFLIMKPNDKEPDIYEKRNKMNSIAKQALLEDTITYDYGIIWNDFEYNTISTEYNYVYLPVWLYYEEKMENDQKNFYYIAINGRTNELGLHVNYEKSVVNTRNLIISAVLSFLLCLSSIPLVIAKPIGNNFVVIFRIVAILAFAFFTYLIYGALKRKTVIKYSSKNVLNKNDKYLNIETKILERKEKKLGKIKFGSHSLRGRNDKFEETVKRDEFI